MPDNKERPSTNSFTDLPVRDDVTLVDGALHAPAGENRQTVEEE